MQVFFMSFAIRPHGCGYSHTSSASFRLCEAMTHCQRECLKHAGHAPALSNFIIASFYRTQDEFINRSRS